MPRRASAPTVVPAPAIAIAILIAITFASAPARAEPSFASSEQMAGHMDDWFRGEESESWVFLGAGLASLGGGVYLATRDDDLAKGAGYTTAAMGGLLTAFSITYNLSLTPTHDDLKQQLRADPTKYKADETDRMQAISDRFVLYRWVELAVLATGAGLITYGVVQEKKTFTGVGIGLASEAALLLTLDFFAERRTHRYLDQLHAFEPGQSGIALSRDSFFLSTRMAF